MQRTTVVRKSVCQMSLFLPLPVSLYKGSLPCSIYGRASFVQITVQTIKLRSSENTTTVLVLSLRSTSSTFYLCAQTPLRPSSAVRPEDASGDADTSTGGVHLPTLFAHLVKLGSEEVRNEVGATCCVTDPLAFGSFSRTSVNNILEVLKEHLPRLHSEYHAVLPLPYDNQRRVTTYVPDMLRFLTRQTPLVYPLDHAVSADRVV